MIYFHPPRNQYHTFMVIPDGLD